MLSFSEIIDIIIDIKKAMATTSLSVSGKNLDKVPESLNVLYNVYNGLSIVRLVILVNTSGKVVQL